MERDDRSGSRITDRIRRLGRKLSALETEELLVLVLLAAGAAGIWIFAEIADEVLENELDGFDQRVLLALRDGRDPDDPLGPRWVEEMLRDFTALGGLSVLILATLTVAGFLFLQKKRHAALLVVVAVASGQLVTSVLKGIFDRARPDLVPHGSHVYTSSFPSGHSMMSAVTWLTLAALMARVQKRRRDKLFILSMAAFVCLLVGASRVYLGVHWPTDVMAGWVAGGVWAIACWITAWWLQRRGRVEK